MHWDVYVYDIFAKHPQHKHPPTQPGARVIISTKHKALSVCGSKRGKAIRV